jgi:hypothetical protein
MTAERLRQPINENPFRPTLSDARVIDASNNDVAFVKKNKIEIGTNLGADPIGAKVH